MEMSDKNISHASAENRCVQCFCGDARNRVRIILVRALARFLQTLCPSAKKRPYLMDITCTRASVGETPAPADKGRALTDT